MRQLNFKTLLEFRSFSEIFYCSMTRPRDTNLNVFIQCKYTRTISRKINMGQSLFKKYSEFQNFNERIYCGMARPRDMTLNVFIQCQYLRNVLRKKNMGKSLFKKYSIFKILMKYFLWHNQTLEHDFELLWFVLIRESFLNKENCGTESFKNNLNFKTSIKLVTVTWSNAGTNHRKFLENIMSHVDFNVRETQIAS